MQEMILVKNVEHVIINLSNFSFFNCIHLIPTFFLAHNLGLRCLQKRSSAPQRIYSWLYVTVSLQTEGCSAFKPNICVFETV